MKFLSSTLLVLSASSAFCFQTSPSNVLLSSTSLQSSTTLYMADEKRRVVVTGLGVVSGCGTNPDDFFQACLEGKSSLGKIQRFDASAYPCQIASEVLDFNAEDYFVNPKNVRSNDRFTHFACDYFVNPKNVRSNDRFSHFAVASARKALKHAGLGDIWKTLQNMKRSE